jgi:putative FmdB family regulatory protein
MPLYEYKCLKCHKKIEIIQKVGEPGPQICPYCGGTLIKLISIPSIQFKGSGWYVTDYAGDKRHLNSSKFSNGHKKNQPTNKESAKNNRTEKINPKHH